jgi:hypothetical protein
MEDLYLLVNGGDKKTLNFREARDVGEKTQQEDTIALAIWLAQNLGSESITTLIMELHGLQVDAGD